MRVTGRVLALSALLALPAQLWATNRGRADRGSCPADVDAAVAEHCPCDGSMNHGQYVSCVAHYGLALRKAGCRAGTAIWLTRCAAISTCGRPGAVVCCTTSGGTCDGGVCSNKAWLGCVTDADCTRTRPRIASDQRACVAAGGVSAGPGSMCGACMPAATTTSTTSTSTTTTVVRVPATTSSTTTTTTTTTTTVPVGVTYGNANEFAGASQHTPGYLLGGPITVPQSSTLTHLGVIAKSGGPHVILALYSETAGEPDRLVAAVPATTMTPGAMEIPVAPTQLPAGRYWMLGEYDGDASIGIDESDPNAPVRYLEQSFSDPLPDPLPPAFGYSGQAFNYYVRVAE